MNRIRQNLEGLLQRGRRAVSHADQRLGGVPSLLKATFDSYNAHDGTFISAALSYFFFFSLFPLVLAVITIGSLFLESERARALVVDIILRIVPVFESVIVQNVDLVLSQRGAVSIVVALGFVYAASGLFGALLAVENRIWACPAARPSYVQRLLAIALVLAFTLFFFVAATATTAFQGISDLARQAGLEPQAATTLYSVVSVVGSIVGSGVVFLFIYWKLPATKVYLADAWPAAVAAALAWEGLRQLYAWYLSRFTNYTLIYGSLAAIIGLLSWLYLTAFIFLLGAELSGQIAERRGRGPTSCKR